MRSHPGRQGQPFGMMSEAMTLAAPAARATPTAKQPIGPHPTMNTMLPGMSADNTAWNAFPIGSMMAPTSSGCRRAAGHWWPA